MVATMRRIGGCTDSPAWTKQLRLLLATETHGHAKSEGHSLGFAFENVTMRTSEPMASAGAPFAPSAVIQAWGGCGARWLARVEEKGVGGGNGEVEEGGVRAWEIEAEGPRFTAVSLGFCTTHQISAACRLELRGRAVRSEGLTLSILRPSGRLHLS